jgi:ABC-type Fe3+-hydroxamate transport system substrate-binding protein
MPVYTDQLGNTVDIPSFPQRIVSLVPSQTELLFHLGLDDRVAGITKFCVHPPEWFHAKKRTGGTKTVKFEVMSALNPDLVLANKEENMKDQVEELAKHYPVWTSQVHNLDSALDMIYKVGTITVPKKKPLLSFPASVQALATLKRKTNNSKPLISSGAIPG